MDTLTQELTFIEDDPLMDYMKEVFTELTWHTDEQQTISTNGEYIILPYDKWFKAYFHQEDMTPLNPLIDLDNAKDICNTHFINSKKEAILKELMGYDLEQNIEAKIKKRFGIN